MVDSRYWDQCIIRLQEKVNQMIAAFDGKCPSNTDQEGTYQFDRVDGWTSGFWPGILWILHDVTGEKHYRDEAWDWDEQIERMMIQPNQFIHDVGFQFMCTAVLKYQLTGDEEAKRRGLQAANFLAGRFNPAGNFIRAWMWDGDIGWAIVDCTMNLSLLYWASEVSKDPRFKHIANLHAQTVLEHFVRPDGSANHIVSFDPETGECLGSLGGQGYSPDSSWSRGQAWALYGLANVARYTENPEYLAAAKRVAHYFVSHLPEDAIPYWDFRLPNPEGEPRDSSAAAIAASGLFEIAELVPTTEKPLYYRWAERLVQALTERCTTWERPDYQSVLTHGTGNKPANSHIEVGLIYGDYYYVEAVAKLSGWKRKVF